MGLVRKKWAIGVFAGAKKWNFVVKKWPLPGFWSVFFEKWPPKNVDEIRVFSILVSLPTFFLIYLRKK